MKPIDQRIVAKARGAAQRAYAELMTMAQHTDDLEHDIALQGRIVIEEMDLLRHLLRQATLRDVIESCSAGEAPAPAPAPSKHAAGGHARAAKLPPTQRKAIAQKAAKARWGKELKG